MGFVDYNWHIVGNVWRTVDATALCFANSSGSKKQVFDILLTQGHVGYRDTKPYQEIAQQVE